MPDAKDSVSLQSALKGVAKPLAMRRGESAGGRKESSELTMRLSGPCKKKLSAWARTCQVCEGALSVAGSGLNIKLFGSSAYPGGSRCVIRPSSDRRHSRMFLFAAGFMSRIQSAVGDCLNSHFPGPANLGLTAAWRSRV